MTPEKLALPLKLNTSPPVPLEMKIMALIRQREAVILKVNKLLATISLRMRAMKSNWQLNILPIKINCSTTKTLFSPIIMEKAQHPEKKNRKAFLFQSIDLFFLGEDYSIKLILKSLLQKLSNYFVSLRFLLGEICRNVLKWRNSFAFEKSDNKIFYYNNQDYFCYVTCELDFLQQLTFSYSNKMIPFDNDKSSFSLEEVMQISFSHNPLLLPNIIYESESYLIRVSSLLYEIMAASKLDEHDRDVAEDLESKVQHFPLKITNPILDSIEQLKKELDDVKSRLENGYREIPGETDSEQKGKVLAKKPRRRRKHKIQKKVLDESPVEIKPLMQEVPEKTYLGKVPDQLKQLNSLGVFSEKLCLLPGYLHDSSVSSKNPISLKFKSSNNYYRFLSQCDEVIIFLKYDFDQIYLHSSSKQINYRRFNRKLQEVNHQWKFFKCLRCIVKTISETELVLCVISACSEVQYVHDDLMQNRVPNRLMSGSGNNSHEKVFQEVGKFISSQNFKVFKIIRKQMKRKRVFLKGNLMIGSKIVTGSSDPSQDIRYDLLAKDLVRLDGWFITTVKSVEVQDADDEKLIKIHLQSELSSKLSEGSLIDVSIEKLLIPTTEEFNLPYEFLRKRPRTKRDQALLEQAFEFFGYRISGLQLDHLIGENEHNKRVSDFVSQLDTDFVLESIFEYLCFNWFPVSSTAELDNAKFMKFLKELPEVINIYESTQKATDELGLIRTERKSAKKGFLSLSQVDLIFAKAKDRSKRKIVFDVFRNNALVKVAAHKYPWLAQTTSADAEESKKNEEVLAHFIRNHVLVWKETSAIVYHEAQKLAFYAEAMQQLASKKIQTCFRRFTSRSGYLTARIWIERIQHNFRCHRNRLEFKYKLLEVKELVLKAKRERISRRDARQQRFISSKVIFINGIIHLTKFYRAPDRAVLLVVYNSLKCQYYNFLIKYDNYVQMILQSLKNLVVTRKGKSSSNSLVVEKSSNADAEALEMFNVELIYSKQYLEFILNRLKYRRTKDSVILGKKESGNATGKIWEKRGVYLSDIGNQKRVFYILTVLSCLGNLFLEFYDNVSRTLKYLSLDAKQIENYFKLAESIDYNSKDDRKRLISMLVERTTVCTDCKIQAHKSFHQQGKYVINFQFHLEREKEAQAASKVQSLYRRWKAITDTKQIIRKTYRKQRDLQSGQWYYVNLTTNEVSWKKPFLMLSSPTEDLEDPDKDLWVEFYDDSTQRTLYFHPYSGKTSIFSEKQAHDVIRKFYRKKQSLVFKVKNMRQVSTALRLQNDIEQRHLNHPEKLPTKFNYSLYLLTNRLDIATGTKILRECLDESPNNPLIRLAGAIITLFECKHPVEHNYLNAKEEIARVGKEGNNPSQIFDNCYMGFFHWGVVANGEQVIPFLLCALCLEHIFNDRPTARKFYNKSMSLLNLQKNQALSRQVTVNFTFFKQS